MYAKKIFFAFLLSFSITFIFLSGTGLCELQSLNNDEMSEVYAKTGFTDFAINDLGDPKLNAHLLSRDTVHGRFAETVSHDEENLFVGEDKIRNIQSQYQAELIAAWWLMELQSLTSAAH